jgi:methylphosphotriester-DNA--protein-cysteine methyltransferase
MREFSGQAIDLGAVFRDGAADLVPRIQDAGGWEAAFEVVAQFLRTQFAAGPEPAPAVAWAVRMLERSNGLTGIAELAAEIGCSRRYLGAAFRRYVGLPPKAYARLLRFRRAFDRLKANPSVRLDQLAIESGYFDQAHFSRDFSEFAGTSPGRFRAGSAPGAFPSVQA